jgi:3-phenylpropionate/trans-cinnamate dioxygenase ferredoxin subunit
MEELTKTSVAWEKGTMERFVNVAKVDEVKRGKGKLVLVEGQPVAILNSDGAFYAIEDSCPLDDASLSDGFLAGSVVECPGDKARFFVPTGDCLWPREGKHLRSYRVRVDKEDIYVELGQSLTPETGEEEIGAAPQPDTVMSVGVL